MSRRGRSGPTISLFSFQDIITSVTAIVTVVTLLLALDLVQRKQAQSSDSSESTATDLAARVEELESEIASLQSSFNADASVARDVIAISPNDLKNEIIAKRAAIAALEAKRSHLEVIVKDWQRREKQELARQFDQQPLKDEQQAMSKTIADLEHEIKDLEADERVIYQMPRGSNRSGWIVEVELGVISAAQIGQRQKPIRFEAKSGKDLHIASFETWLREDGRDKSYFFFVVKPVATTEYYRLQPYLRSHGISYGVDLMDFDEQVLDPELGASR